jgi:hypothetical protein
VTNRSVRRINSIELASLDVDASWNLVKKCRSVNLKYTFTIFVLGAMTKQMAKFGNKYSKSYLISKIGEPDLHCDDNETWVYRHHSRDHCIILDIKNGCLSGFGTAIYSQTYSQ